MKTLEKMKYLSDLELEIYQYIIAHRSQVISMKLKDISEAIHVSPAMITRVAKKLGYDGFAEWKVVLKTDEGVYVKPNETSLNNIFDFFNRVDSSEYDNIIRSAAKMIAQSSEALFYGLGISGAIANMGALVLNRCGKKAYCIPEFSNRSDGIYTGQEVGIILSVSGETPETIQVMTLLKQQGVKLIAITNVNTSLVAKLADLAICYYIPNYRRDDHVSTATQVPVIYIIESIANELKNFGVI